MARGFANVSFEFRHRGELAILLALRKSAFRVASATRWQAFFGGKAVKAGNADLAATSAKQ